MLVKTRIPHETKLPSVVQVPYSSTFVKITAVHVHITFASRCFLKFKGPKLGCALDSMAHLIRVNMIYNKKLHNLCLFPAVLLLWQVNKITDKGCKCNLDSTPAMKITFVVCEWTSSWMQAD